MSDDLDHVIAVARVGGGDLVAEVNSTDRRWSERFPASSDATSITKRIAFEPSVCLPVAVFAPSKTSAVKKTDGGSMRHLIASSK